MNQDRKELITGIFNDSYPPITDGVAMVTKSYAYWLNRIAGPSCVITPDMPGHYDSEEYPVYRYFSVPLRTRPPYRFGMNLVGEMHEKRRRGQTLTEQLTLNIFDIPFSIVHAHCPFTSGDLARRVALARKIPLVATFHTKYKEDFKRSLKGDLLVDIATLTLSHFYNQANFVWVPSSETVTTLRSYGYKGDIEVMANGTDLVVEESDLPRLRDEGAAFLEIPEGPPVLLYIGQHIKEKNLDLILESLVLLKEKNIDFRMVFIGDGYHRADMERFVAEHGLAGKVLFKGIVRDRELIKRAYARADILYFPSLYDTSSLIVKEAAGMRLPTLLVSGSTTAQGIEDGTNGFLAENTAEAMAACLGSALVMPAKRKAAGEGAYRTLYRSWENVIVEVTSRYRDILADWKPE